MRISYYTRQNYGNTVMYFAETHEQVRAIQQLTRHKILTPYDKLLLEALGFTFERVLEPVENEKCLC